MPLAGARIRALDFTTGVYDAETANDTTTSTTFVDGTVNGVAFVAPTSGAVWIRFGGLMGSNSTTVGLRVVMSFYVRTGSTIDAGTDVLVADDERSIKHYKQTTDASFLYVSGSGEYLLSGLTAGSSYNAITQFRAGANTAAVDNRWIAVAPAFS